jgi:uncharacterized protein
MRTPSDLPRRFPRASRRTRVTLVVGVVALIVLIVFLNGLARFWISYLWFQSVGFTSVFRGVLLTKVILALVFIALFFLLMLGNLTIVDRLAPEDPGDEDELVSRYREVVRPHARAVRIVTAAIFALLGGIGADREWNNWDLLRYHVSFGVSDQEFHKDVGFYVFELPFIKFLLGWVFEALVIVLIVTVVYHYLNGGIQVQGATRRVSPAVKTHVSVLLGVLALVKGVEYYYDRYSLVLSRSHVVNGATATSVHANLPALTLLIAIAVIAAGLFLFNIRQKGWTLPVVAVGLWVLVDIIVGGAYPALYQALRVNPSELTREAPYIQRNIDATRRAYGLDNVQVDTSYKYTPTVTDSEIQGSSPQAEANQETLANVRLLDPAVSLINTFDKYQALRSYYSFSNLSLDRYTTPDPGSPSGETLTATIAAVRELNTSVPSGFVNQHLEYTHGYGAVLAPISESGVNADGTPDFTLQNLPPSGSPELSDTGSQIYYGEGTDTGGFVIADSKTPELDYENGDGVEVATKYAGTGGVEAGSLIRRAAFALNFGDANFILSGQITPSSRVMFNRNINTMVRKAAPFLKYDSDPYAVILNKQVYWIVDAYTTTDNYPYSQNANTTGVNPSSGLNSTFNYVSNSVKVVINAYTGKMDFVVVNPNDPIIQVYERAFPDLFMSESKVESQIPGIEDHFRYPEDLFTVQTNMYGRYHLTNPSAFYTQAQAWTVPPDPGSGPLSSAGVPVESIGPNNTVITTQQQMPPQYMLAHLPGSTQQSFLLFEPFVPIGSSTTRQNLTAWMTASSNPPNYGVGTLDVYESPSGETVYGPALVTNLIRTDTAISSQLTLLNQQGSIVEVGEVAVVPIDQTLLYVEPIYVESSANGIPTLKDVVVVYNGQAYQSENASLDNALCQVVNPNGSKPFEPYCTTQAALSAPLLGGSTSSSSSSGSSSSSSTSTTTTTVPSTATPPATAPAGSTSVASLLTSANNLNAAAGTALKAGDTAAAEADISQAKADVARAQQLIGQP